MNLMWFRSDLRLHDNPALHHAVKNGPTIAVFCLPQQQWRKHSMAPIKQNFILRHLVSLRDDLKSLNIPLLVVNAHDFSGIVSQLKILCKDHQVKNIFFNHEYEWNEQILTQEVQAGLNSIGVITHDYHDQCLIKPGEIRNKQGSFYKVFTAFKKAYQSELTNHCRNIYPKPKKQNTTEIKLPVRSDITCVLDQLKSHEYQSLEDTWQNLWPVSEEYALNLLEQFAIERMADYQKNRDIPSIEGTSKLSAYLAIGAISVRQCYQAAVNSDESVDSIGVSTWINELIWRDFYRHLMAAFPEICRYKPFKAHTDQLPWKQTGPLFKAWCEGKTGYPLVDAAMRQLLQTGWMHNRLRMVAAMFLTKHLFIDWRLGEQYFMEHLIDGDLASNNGGWQWSASTGVDAVPYFRIFNPIRQSQRFDENGDFIRQYVPELKSLNNKSIHQPNKQDIIQCGYVSPIVDHKAAVSQTKMHFKNLADTQLTFEPLEYGVS